MTDDRLWILYLGFITLAVLLFCARESSRERRLAAEVIDALRSELKIARLRADEADSRLYAAWREGYTIPEPDAEPIEDEPLPPVLREWLSQWEGAEAQQKWDAELRRKLAQGRTPDQILMDLEVAS